MTQTTKRVPKVGDRVVYLPNPQAAGLGRVREQWLDGRTYTVDFQDAKGETVDVDDLEVHVFEVSPCATGTCPLPQKGGAR